VYKTDIKRIYDNTIMFALWGIFLLVSQISNGFRLTSRIIRSSR
jgi:hypothetical protein